MKGRNLWQLSIVLLLPFVGIGIGRFLLAPLLSGVAAQSRSEVDNEQIASPQDGLDDSAPRANVGSSLDAQLAELALRKIPAPVSPQEIAARVFLVTAPGSRLPAENGAAKWLRPDGQAMVAEISAGACREDLCALAWETDVEIRLGGFKAAVLAKRADCVPPEIDLHLPPAEHLHVLDAAGQPVPNLQLVTADRFQGTLTQCPPDDRRQACPTQAVDNPLPLPARILEIDAWVGAPGFAWSHLRLGPKALTQPLVLTPGTDLKVTCEPATPLAFDLHLTIHQGKKLCAERTLPAGASLEALTFDGLQPGSATLQAWRVQNCGLEIPLCNQTLELAAGSSQICTLSAAELQGPELSTGQARLAITARVGEFSITSKVRLSHESFGEFSVPIRAFKRPRLPDPDLRYHTLELADLPAGNWHVRVDPSGFEGQLEVLPDRPAALDINAQELCRLQIWTPVEGPGSLPQGLSWRSSGKNLGPTRWEFAQRKSTRDPFVLLVSPGTIEVRDFGSPSDSGIRMFTVSAGVTDQTL
jgi:hypothetical protein